MPGRKGSHQKDQRTRLWHINLIIQIETKMGGLYDPPIDLFARYFYSAALSDFFDLSDSTVNLTSSAA